MRGWPLLLIVASCAAPQPEPSSYHVSVSPGFTEEERAAVLDGLSRWTAAVPELHLTVSIETCRPPGVGENCIIRSSEIAGTHAGWTSGAGVTTLFPDAIALHADASLAQVAAHELGHEMSLVHTGKGTLMYLAPDSDAADAPTAADVAQWRSLR